MTEDVDMCYNRKADVSGREEIQARKRGAYAVLAGAALIMVCAPSFTAFAKEERIPVGKIKLNFTSGIQAGENGGNVDVTLGGGECSIESADIINEDNIWAGGDKSKVEIWLSVDSDYYFKKSGKSAFSFFGGTIKYVSSSTKNDEEEMVLVVRLDRLDEDDEGLDISGLMWDEDNGVAHWDDMSLAKNYKVRLCWRGDNSHEDGIGAAYTVKEDSYDFSGKSPKAGTYYFKVRAMDLRSNAGDWQEPPYLEVTEKGLTRVNGQRLGDDRGWWYQKGDGTYPLSDRLYTNYEWYFFDQEGYMKIGWVSWEDKLYYCDPPGAMPVPTVTPDGFTMGANGTRLGQ